MINKVQESMTDKEGKNVIIKNERKVQKTKNENIQCNNKVRGMFRK